MCFQCRPKDWYPLIYNPVFSTYSEADLVFHIGLMNGACQTSTYNTNIDIYFKLEYLKLCTLPALDLSCIDF